jgi:hypothetical protein
MMSSIRRSVLIGAQILVLALSLTPVRAFAQALYQFDLPTQTLSDTLRAIGSKSGINVAFDPAAVRGKTAAALSGSYTGEDAIKRVLQGTGLTMREVKDGSVLILDPSQTQGSASNEEPNLQEVLVTAQKSVQLATSASMTITRRYRDCRCSMMATVSSYWPFAASPPAPTTHRPWGYTSMTRQWVPARHWHAVTYSCPTWTPPTWSRSRY